jgi:PAS domain S-box-containing protein
VSLRVPVSLKFTVPFILLAFVATLTAVNLLYHVPRAERAAEEDGRKRLAQEMSRLQSTLEYLLLKGDQEGAQHEIAVLAHNHDVTLAALTDDTATVVTGTRRAWLGRPIAEVLPQFDLRSADAAIRERREGMAILSTSDELLGRAGLLLGADRGELRPSRAGSVYLVYDLKHYKAEARAQVVQQSLYWAGWVTALALAMWLVFHFLLTRRTARLVGAAEQLAAGDLSARSDLKGTDELGRLSRAFDAMARKVATDITDRKRSAEALRVSEASYRAIFEASEDSIFVHDAGSGAMVDVNAKACSTFGYTREEFRAIDIGALGSGVHPYTQQEAMKLIRRAYEGEDLRIEWHGRTKDGTLRWHEVFIKCVMIGGQDRILALARDITARKTAEAALRASEEQYHSMFNASIDGLALWNADGDMVDSNPALWSMYGHDDVEPGRDPPDLARPTCDPAFLRAVAAGDCLHVEVTHRRPGGDVVDLEVHGVPMQYQGHPHVLTITRDVTEKKRSAVELTRQRESLYQREKLAALGSLLAGVAHELNNPLSVVVARAVLLEERGDPATQAAATKIRTAAERCARIVRTFLAMARQQPPERMPVALNDVVVAALDIAGYALRSSGVEVELALADDLPRLLADADQLHQVVLNLVINAQQAMQDRPAPRRLRVATRHDASSTLRIVVADNGPGIPPDLRARVFEPYFTTKSTGVGLGVGLAVSLGIVEAHGGTLTVDCPADGGAVFEVALPVGATEVAGAVVEPACTPAADPRAVLVVDDESEIRDTLVDILSAAHHRVAAVGSGREALQRLAVEHFDVILTDMRMPDIDGRALYQEIERRWPGRSAHVVFVTGDTLASAMRDFVFDTGRPVIEKPFLPSEVRRVVEAMEIPG